jgi:Flp pilus assembly protein TadD
MKALEKDRTRRYDTASSLAHDIQRHLHNEPVVASPPSKVYRFQKLVRRNKSVFVASGAVALALIIGFISSLYLLAREKEAHRRAVAAEQEQARMRQEAEEGARIGQGLSRAGLLLSREQWEEAEKLVNELPPDPASIAILNVLGMVHARRGQWPEAVRCFARSTELDPTDHDAYHCLAPLLARSGDVKGYRNLCARILLRFANTSDPTIAERMAKDCLILPDSHADVAVINRMVNTALAAGADHPFWGYFQFVKGLAEYRQGRFSTAAEWVSKVTSEGRDPNRTLAATIVLAMAQYQLKQTNQARVTLEKGVEFANANVRNTQGPQWNDQLSARLFMEEAKALIGGDFPEKAN